MTTESRRASPLYARVAGSLVEQLQRGALRPGDRAHSLRRVSRQHRVSMATAIQAYRWLEERGYLEARAKSGFFVRTPHAEQVPEPLPLPRPTAKSVPLSHAVIREVLAAADDPDHVPFGAGCVDPELFPGPRLNQILRRVVARHPHHSAHYAMPPGFEPLRRQVARRSQDLGFSLAPDELTITTGALDATRLALRAVARPGDTIAIESPTYFGFIDAAAAEGMKLLEIPTHPRDGLDLDALERAIRRRRVRACYVMTNGHNPLGYVLPDEFKKSLVALTARHGVAVIEDDVYGDLTFAGPRPRTVKSFDRDGGVLYCSSFSKVLSPGYRIGWIAPGRYRDEVNRLKFFSDVAAPSLPQRVIAEFLATGGYDRHLHRMRARLADQLARVRHAIGRYFPDGTRVSKPAGGHLLWVELPGRTDGIEVFRRAQHHHISVLPGPIFSPTRRYRNYLRLNAGQQWSERHERALLTLGRLCLPRD